MKKLIYIIGIIFLIACDKLPINGKLDGMWQLQRVEYMNGQTESLEKTYYSIQLHLIKLTKVYDGDLYGSKSNNYIGRFIYTKDSLYIHDFRPYKNEGNQATLEQLLPFGMSEVSERFKIEELNRKKMILKSKHASLFFIKF